MFPVLNKDSFSDFGGRRIAWNFDHSLMHWEDPNAIWINFPSSIKLEDIIREDDGRVWEIVEVSKETSGYYCTVEQGSSWLPFEWR